MQNSKLTYHERQVQREEKSCVFCGRLQENKVLILMMLRKLEKEMKKYSEQHAVRQDVEEASGFRQMINIIFGEQANSNCAHRYLYCFILKKLKVSHQHLQFLCQKILAHIAQRNYQLEITSLQIKNVAKTLEDHPDAVVYEKGKKQRSQIKESKTKKQRGTDLTLKSIPEIKSEQEMIEYEEVPLMSNYQPIQSAPNIPMHGSQSAGYPPNYMYYPYPYYLPPPH